MMPASVYEREIFDSTTYVERIQHGPCFICEMVAGKSNGNHIVYQDGRAIVFLNKYPTLYGYTLVAPREHREQVTGDFQLSDYLDLQRLIHCVAEAVRAETNAERVYVLSLGSQQANSHVHWHIAPLPPGVPFEKQQLAALRFSSGVLKIPETELSALATRLRARIEKSIQPFIRPLAICVFRDGDRILVFEGYDPLKDQFFYRPLGGGINPGEYARDAIVREIREEIGAEIIDVRCIGTLENIFTFNGKPGHEIVMVFDASFIDSSFYRQEQIDGVDDGVTPLKVIWKSLDSFHEQGAPPLYPNGLLDLLSPDPNKL
jgi:diadenosine tetraphosphate (Ap4A) HIT family hydrolase/8-oxo-dGTP pyrophosphatase MutT (NUDIX family)